jgi:hypothetical protein
MSEIKIPEAIHHSHQFQQQDLGETIQLIEGKGPGEVVALGEIYSAYDFPCVGDERVEEVEAIAIATADKIVRAYNCHDELVAKLEETAKVIAEWPTLHEGGDYLHGWILNSIRDVLAKAKPEAKGETG